MIALKKGFPAVVLVVLGVIAVYVVSKCVVAAEPSEFNSESGWLTDQSWLLPFMICLVHRGRLQDIWVLFYTLVSIKKH